MAMLWHAQGPTTIQLANNQTVDNWANFAMTDNEDLCRFEIEDIMRDFTRNDLGDMVAESVYTGSVCFIEFSTIYWDEPLWQSIMALTRLGDVTQTSQEGKHAVVGSLLRTPDAATIKRMFGLKIITSKVGEKSYSFASCRIAGPHRDIDFGNTMKRKGVRIEALPDGSGRFYTPTTNT